MKKLKVFFICFFVILFFYVIFTLIIESTTKSVVVELGKRKHSAENFLRELR